MRMLLSLVLALAMLAAGPAADAATPSAPAFRTVKLSHYYPWTDGFGVTILPDEAICRAKYGDQWKVKCAASLGAPGESVEGVTLTPPLKGRWMWESTTRMAFSPDPETPPTPGTTYTVDISGMPCPASVVLNKKTLSVTTTRLSVRLLESRFWPDPSPSARHRVSASLEFNYPVRGLDPVITCIAPADIAAGKAELIWNEARDRVNVSFPITRLPERNSEIRILVEGVPQFTYEGGKLNFYQLRQGEKGASFGVAVTGSRSLFSVNKARLSWELDDGLSKMHVLSLETSLYTTPEEVLKNLDIWQLPLYATPEARRPCDWTAAPTIPGSTLAKARKLTPVSLMKDNAPTAKLRFRIPVEPGHYILAGMNEKFRSASGHSLGRTWRQIMKAWEFSTSLNFLQPGSVLALSGRKMLDIYAVGLDAVRWQAQKVRDPFLALLAQGSDSAFTEPLSYAGIGLDAVSENCEGELPLPASSKGQAQFAALDLSPVLSSPRNDTHGLMKIRLTGMKDGESIASAERMILITDLGLMLKRTALGGYEAFVHSFKDGKPAAHAKVSILGANGRPCASAVTDDLGHASLPSLTGLARESRPIAAVAESSDGRDLAWLPLTDRSRVLDYSDFPTGGKTSSQDGINAFVFAQRGMFRPGETLHFGCVIRRADWAPLPADTPLAAVLRDPAGRTVLKKNFTPGAVGMALLDWSSAETSPTGRYTLTVTPSGSSEILGAASVRMEEFQPDTLSLKMLAPEARGWLIPAPGKALEVGLLLKNLYGTAAANHKVKGRVEASPAHFRFAGFEQFQFLDPAPLTVQEQARDLAEGRTDAEGRAAFLIPSELIAGTSVRCRVTAEGFEADGGRATSGEVSFLVSPHKHMLGWKPSGALTNLAFIPQNEKAELEFVAVNNELSRIPVEELTFSVALRRYATSLVSDRNGNFRYDETPLDVPFSTSVLSIGADGLHLPLNTAEAGEYLLTVRDRNGTLLASVPYAVAGEKLLAPGTELASGKMRLRLDKTSYASGDTMKLALSLPYDGTGLITLEREGVEAFAWFSAKAGDTVQNIAIPKDFEGRGYVNVSFVRAPESKAVYMEPHTYAAAPFSANIVQRDLALRLEAPASVQPGSTLRVTLRSAEAGKAVLFAVDEGVLQLTRFTTPSPLFSLLEDRALGVRTLQAFDLLMPDHALMAGRWAAFGGDTEGSGTSSRFLNPFKRRGEPPLATWSALLDVTPEGVSAEIPIPSYYNGKLRIMAVGVSAERAGSAACPATVKAPLVLTPQTPLTLSPADTFHGALVLANTENRTVRTELSCTADGPLVFLTPLPQFADLRPDSELTLPFSMRAGEEPGTAELRFTARCDGREYARSASLSVRPASPLKTSVQAGVTDDSSAPATDGSASTSAALPVDRSVYAFGARSEASLSPLPLPLAKGLAAYLDAYPFDCTEQLISRAFAHLALRSYPGLLTEKERERALSAAVNAIRERVSYMGVSLWPGGQPDALLTAYAADFLLSMREAGLGADDGLLDSVCNAVERHVPLNRASLSAARTSAYGIWVLTREGRITTRLIEDLQTAMKERGLQSWKKDVTAMLLAASQRQMLMRKTISFKSIEYTPEGWFDELAQKALHAALLARHFPEHCTDEVKSDLFESTAMAMKASRYATFSAAQSARALLAIGGSATTDLSQMKLRCADGEGDTVSALLADGALLSAQAPLCRSWTVEMPVSPGGTPRLYWQMSTTGYDRVPNRGAAAKGMEVSRVYLDARGEPVQSVRQGEEVTVKITARALKPRIADCVISDLLPGGFEMVIPRGEEDALPSGVKYRDRREDRMLLFTDLTTDTLIFTYRIRAVNRGMFTVPPVQAEAMYDQSSYGHGDSGSIEIH